MNPWDYQVSLAAINSFGCTHQALKTLTVYPSIDAVFDASDTAGCHPLEVDFSNLGSGGQQFVWDFGDGSTSNETDPVHRFTNTGTVDSVYTVKLMALAPNNICTDSFFMDIRVHPYLQANFVIPEHLDCTPFETQILNSSVNASIFRWDFGDGSDTTTFDTQPFTHRFINTDFALQAEYEITLVAENFAGCTDEISRTITVEPDIDADFSVSRTRGCHPLEVDFTDLSQGAGRYLWDFGNGTTSQDANPSHTFNNLGSSDTLYRVWLRITAPNQVCTDSFFVDITVHPYINADFTFQEQVNCTPSPVEFQNASVGGTEFRWDFGDGNDTTTLDMSAVNHSFLNGSFENNAVFQVSMVAENDAGCVARVSKPVEVYPAIQAEFAASVTEGCHPLEVDFSNLSGGARIYSWDFGDGASSEADAPSYTFTNYTDAPLTRTVTLLATSRFNCTHEVSADIVIHPKPVARFETERNIDCPPFMLPFENTSLNADNYRWDLAGDTLINTSSEATFSHSFANGGAHIATYPITLVAYIDLGCLDTMGQDIYVYPATIAALTVNDGDCSPFFAYFVNESVRGQTYDWDFGDGTGASTTDPSKLYFNLTGYDTVYHITLTSTSQHGCTDSFSDSIPVYAQPVVEFVATPTHQMYPSATVSLTNMSNQGYWDYHWNLGDGSTSNLETPADHTYGTWGDYTIWLSASTPHCSDSVAHNVRILAATPHVDFDSVAGACVPYTVQFTNRSIYGETYLWDFDDGTTSTEFEPVHTFDEYGFYNVKLTVTGPGGTEYAYHQLEVYRLPEANFRVSHPLVMMPDEIWMFNLSRHGASYLWDFGDGEISDEESPSHQYTSTGIYDISLEVWSEHGCYDSIVKPAVVEVAAEGRIVFPNAFKPDMSGPGGGWYSLDAPETNKIFHPLWEGVDNYHLEIYNGWGERLFSSEDVNIGWDGYHRGELCDQDVYLWKSWGTFINGEVFDLVGDVTLIWHQR